MDDRQALWILVPLLSLGFAAWLAPLQAYLRTRARHHLALTLGFVGAVLGLLWLFVLDTRAEQAQTPAERAAEEATVYGAPAGFLIIVLVVAGIAFAYQLRPAAFGSVHVDPVAERTRRAHESAMGARRRRTEARALVESDPALARELSVGRPDVPHDYDDGGLIDLNHVPGWVLERDLSWTQEQADALVSARDLIGGFSSLAEVGVVTQVDQRLLDRAAERLVVIA